MILTAAEAKEALGYSPDEQMPARVESILLPAIDDFLKNATGKDWGKLTESYTTVDPLAKQAASVLLVRWFDNPSQIGSANTSFGYGSDLGIMSLITQLHAKALQEAAT